MAMLRYVQNFRKRFSARNGNDPSLRSRGPTKEEEGEEEEQEEKDEEADHVCTHARAERSSNSHNFI